MNAEQQQRPAIEDLRHFIDPSSQAKFIKEINDISDPEFYLDVSLNNCELECLDINQGVGRNSNVINMDVAVFSFRKTGKERRKVSHKELANCKFLVLLWPHGLLPYPVISEEKHGVRQVDAGNSDLRTSYGWKTVEILNFSKSDGKEIILERSGYTKTYFNCG